MQLNEQGIKNRAEWEKAGYQLPDFDRSRMKELTSEKPQWIHFGAGNIFRAFQARVVQQLLDDGQVDTGLIVAEGFDYEIIEKLNHKNDDLSIVVTLKADGSVNKTVVGSIAESCPLDSSDEVAFAYLRDIFCKPSLQMASFTITEKGYSLTDAKGKWTENVAADFAAGPKAPISYMGKVVTLLYARYKSGAQPIAMVSMDNCSHNGDKLKAAVVEVAAAWVQNKQVEAGFLTYVSDADKVSYPWSMIDKITPRPDEQVKEILRLDGVADMEPIITSKNTYAAPFVNAEECEYLVIEDAFPNGRMPLEKAGVIFTTRDIVDKVEKMKVCTCLNPLHTALAVFGCLLGHKLIAEEMKDIQLKKLVQQIGYKEGLPVVVDPGIIDPKRFIDEVLTLRFPNPFMPDTPQRIATDTSQKLAIRFGETVKAYQRSADLEVTSLKMIPLVFAGWLRYLMAVDDKGQPFTLSPDPMLSFLNPMMQQITFGVTKDTEQIVKPILENSQIFGVNLYEAGMAKQVVEYFDEMNRGVGAVRRVLKQVTE